MGILGRNTEIGPDTILQRKNEIIYNLVDGEVVMLSVENGEYYGINQIGSQIWELIEKRTTLGELVHTLTKEYNVEEIQCLNETTSFIAKLVEKNLVIIE